MPSTAPGKQPQPHLLARLAEARSQTDRLFDVVKRAGFYERPIPERHRIVFYFGHLEAFDWNLLRGESSCDAPWHPEFDKLFAFGIDPVDGRLPADQPEDWPVIDEVRFYNQRVRRTLDARLEKIASAGDNAFDASLAQRMNVAIEHRLMHEETLSYMLHQLPLDRKVRQTQAAAPPAAPPFRPEMIEIPAGRATLGLPRAEAGTFGWDNEYEACECNVPGFAIDRFMVTNGQYLEFVDSGGYQISSLWSSEAWSWINREKIAHPIFWKRVGNRWVWRGMFDEIPLPIDWPVYVSYAEASAFARWTGKSLPTEAQWNRAAYGTPRGDEQRFPWGAMPPVPQSGNFDFARWDPVPVTAFRESASAFGVEGLLGNGWEWTASVFAPFAGFQPFPFYPGYSANFFDGKHYVMKGGSSRTAASMLRPSFRNWFQPHYPYIYAGFRCVVD